MKNSFIKKTFKSVMLAAFFCTCYTMVNAQSENTDLQTESVLNSDSLTIPETYQQTQDQQQEINSPGTATYNIVDTEPGVSTGAAEFHSDSNVEKLRVYSGSQNGNNVIKTIEVQIPPAKDGSNY